MNYSILFLFPLLSFIPTIVHAQGIIPNQDGTDTVVHQQGNQFNIQGGSRSSNNANLFHSFQEFNVNQGQTANFISTPTIKNILGRINGGNPSMINGLIQVTGGNSNLFLMNPAGIIFGANASLNLPASFHVSTATGIGFANNQWFQSIGNNNYENLVSTPNKFIFANTQAGTIINQGKLHLTDKQSLSLLGGSVINTGELSTAGGNITIASVPGENTVKISQVGHLLSLELSPFANVSQSPQIEPVALPQLLTGNISDNQANTITINQFGQVVLGNTNFGINDINQTTINTGKIDISQSNNGISGQVNIIGNKVGLIGGEINASGYNQGGTVLIGGDFQGQGIIPNAWQTYVSQDSIINADAINNGNGGKVIIWSDNQTNFQGSITARGGVNSGNGGLVEISGKKELIFNGKVDVSAINGLPGTVLFDPDNLTLEKSNSSDDSLSDSENKIINDTDDQSSEPVNKSTDLEKSNVTESEEGENIRETAVTKETKTVDKTDSSEANVTLIDGGKTENIGPVVKVANKKDTERTKQTASDSQTKISDKPATAKPTTGNKPQTSTKKPTTTVKTSTNPTNKSNENTAQAKTSPDKTVNDQEKLSVETKVIDPFAPDKSNNIVINSDNVNKLDINKL